MITKERNWELMKQSGLDEKKFAALLTEEVPKLTEKDLDKITGGWIPFPCGWLHND